MKALGRGSIASFIRVGLTIAWWALWVMAAALAAGTLAYIGVYIAIANGVLPHDTLSGGTGVAPLGDGPFRVRFGMAGDATWPIVAPALSATAVMIAGALVIVRRLQKLFDSFVSGEPFHKSNAGHLRMIWIALLVIEVWRLAMAGLTGAMLASFGAPEGRQATVELSIDFFAWAEILILIVLAEVFREGARLREEHSLTI